MKRKTSERRIARDVVSTVPSSRETSTVCPSSVSTKVALLTLHSDGESDGDELGKDEGESLGIVEGSSDGKVEGSDDGIKLGSLVGRLDGPAEGKRLG